MAAPVSESAVSGLRELLERMVTARQLSATDAQALQEAPARDLRATEDEVLRWVASEYGVAFTTLEDVQTDKELLSLFPARILLKEELLPLRRTDGVVEVATARLFAPQGLDALKTLTGLRQFPLECRQKFSQNLLRSKDNSYFQIGWTLKI